MIKHFKVSEEVKQALAQNAPVVALESTIISHGFNYPKNLECALECEKIIKENGATPATIAIIGGKIKVGLTNEEITHLAENSQIPKASRRDVAPLLAMKKDGATTVATTMLFAQMAGIKIFATGGIGGVHRHGNETFDISADLQELAKTNVAVVCAGAKSILDIPLTREYLETFGITVLGYQTDSFPGFYTRATTETVDCNLKTPEEIAKIIQIKDELGIAGGILITNPIPFDSELNPAFITDLIDESLKEAERQNIKGKAITPFLLARLHQKSEGQTIAANKALVYNNAKLAAKIAAELSKL
jgi:pseudouridine-5'-phosphate glycosidase